MTCLICDLSYGRACQNVIFDQQAQVSKTSRSSNKLVLIIVGEKLSVCQHSGKFISQS